MNGYRARHVPSTGALPSTLSPPPLPTTASSSKLSSDVIDGLEYRFVASCLITQPIKTHPANHATMERENKWGIAYNIVCAYSWLAPLLLVAIDNGRRKSCRLPSPFTSAVRLSASVKKYYMYVTRNTLATVPLT